jgi:hypothetical protein
MNLGNNENKDAFIVAGILTAQSLVTYLVFKWLWKKMESFCEKIGFYLGGISLILPAITVLGFSVLIAGIILNLVLLPFVIVAKLISF